MHRFFTDPSCIKDGKITLSSDNLKHINVLRLGKDEQFCVCDGNETDYICRLSNYGRNDKASAVCEVLDIRKSDGEPNFKITLFQGLPKSDKMELIIQKCVELGVYKIVPVITKNTVVKLNGSFEHKTERFNAISESAASQSGRGIIPAVTKPVEFSQAVNELALMDESYMAYEKENKLGLKRAFTSMPRDKEAGKNIGFLIGSEGGFSEKEAFTCVEKGIKTVSLGKRILRTETAGFMILITYLYSRGEL